MDGIPANTIHTERKFFLSKIKSDPVFLFQHTRSFSWILWLRLKTKFFICLRGKHKGLKKHPGWLKNINTIRQIESVSFKELMKQIPERKIISVPTTIATETHRTQDEDLEDYLFANRWNSLVDNVINLKSHFKLTSDVKKWLSSPPPKKDAAWETYSTCERVANLLTWLSFIPVDMRAEISPVIKEFLQESMDWIFMHLEFYGNETGNHILNNARALIMSGTVLKNKHAVRAGVMILKNMLPILIRTDGFLRERSSHYQLIVLIWLLDAFTFAKISNVFPNAELAFVQDTIEQMCHAAAIFCDQYGYLQTFIGDISPDMTPIQTTQRLIACYPNEWPLRIPINLSHTLDWHLLADEHNKVLLNCPAGQYPKQFPSHAHGDLTSFVWLYDNAPVLIDTGRARYTKDTISILQKSAVGHNIALVNNLAPLCESLVLMKKNLFQV